MPVGASQSHRPVADGANLQECGDGDAWTLRCCAEEPCAECKDEESTDTTMLQNQFTLPPLPVDAGQEEVNDWSQWVELGAEGVDRNGPNQSGFTSLRIQDSVQRKIHRIMDSARKWWDCKHAQKFAAGWGSRAPPDTTTLPAVKIY